VAVVTWPAGAAVGYAAVVAGTHLTPFLGLAAANGAAHDAEHALYVVAGYLYFLPLVGSEPIRWRLAMPGRYLLLLATMPVDTIVGIVLMAQARVPFGGYAREGRHWGPSPITDLHTGGAIMWIGSDVLMTALAVAVSAAFLCRPGAAGRLGTWLEGIRAANLARALTDAGVAVPAGSGPAGEHARLRAYNDYLAALAGPGEVNDAADGVAAPPAFPCGEPEVR
jgi:putative copper resistance protein D